MGYQATPMLTEALAWRQKLQSELERYLSLLLEHVSPEKVILFGSMASGEAKAWSDIDLVVVMPTKQRFLDRSKTVLQLFQPRVGVDVLVYTPEEFEHLCRERSFSQQEIVKKGKVLYERSR
ncbi:MAG: nucleotidyltransferase domain-containing protein [Chloroflexota bacterium]|nr:nucleotidyltransferase domain-containing protein [Chloroflexota bacterium]